MRSTESAAIHVLRDIEDEGAKRRAAEIVVRVATPIAMYMLQPQARARVAEIEARYAMQVTFAGDDSLIPPQVRIERVRAQAAIEAPAAITPDARAEAEPVAARGARVEDEPEDVDVDGEQAEAESAQAEADPGAVPGETSEEADRRRRRRRRRRRGGRREDGAPTPGEAIAEGAIAAEPGLAIPPTGAPPGEAGGEADGLVPADLAEHIEGVPEHADAAPEGAGDDEARGRRRGRRGGRRRRRDGADGALEPVAEPDAEQPSLPAYTGPTPANPFGGQAFDIFDVLEQAERAVEQPIASAPQAAWTAAPAAAPSSVPASAPAPAADLALELAAELAAEPSPQPAPEPEPEPGAEPGPEPEPGPGPVSGPAPQPAPALVVETGATEAVPLIDAAPEPAAGAPSPPVPANDAKPETPLPPILVGGEEDAPETEKKRGWWRR